MTGEADKSDCRKARWHETLLDMAAAVTDALIARGHQRTEAEAVAEVAVDAIRFTFGGTQVYIPMSRTTIKDAIHERMFSEFDGGNHHELAERYRVSLQHVYRVIKKQGELARAKRGK